MSSMDFQVNKLLHYGHVIETLLHSTDPFYMQYGNVIVPVTREFLPDSVVCTASFPEHCWIERPTILTLGQMPKGLFAPLLIQTIEWPGDGRFVVRWCLGVHDAQQVS